MKKQILSKGLYIEGLRKLKIPSFIFLAIIVLIQGIIPLLANASNYGPEHSIVISAVDFMGATAIVPVLMAPVLTLIVFYAFNNRSSSDHYQSLPYTRQCLFFSWTLSVLSISCALIWRVVER
mgnify:FL=1